MAVKTFTTGEVLTSTDTNTYLTNAGLVYIKSQPIGTSAASVSVTGAFSAEYDNYKIVISGATVPGTSNMRVTLGGTATGYYGSLIYTRPNVTTVSVDPTNNGARFEYGAILAVGSPGGSFELLGPYLSTKTVCNSFLCETASAASAIGSFNGWLDNTTSYTSFTITPSGGSITGGTVTVYGYRKA